MKKLPELLSPAGSLQAFEAAIDGGADAIYVGGASFNARINAKNFTAEEMREAVKLAHRRNSRLSLAVASAYKVPVCDGAFDLVLNMFSPLAVDEISRVLRKGGIFVMAIPGEEHLFGLKSATYNLPYKNEVRPKDIPGFCLISDERVRYEMHLTSSDEIRALFMMTPYAYRTGKEERERVLSLDELRTDADFYVLAYRKL